MKKQSIVFEKAKKLRKEGRSLKEISDALNVSRSTVSLWMRNIQISPLAQQRILTRQKKGREAGVTKLRESREENLARIESLVDQLIPSLNFSKEQCKGLCALLYGCEGSKREGGRIVFINSDPDLIRFFLLMFRKSFTLDESKFRALVHVHTYHNERKQVRFWSEITEIPKNQFTRSYRKINGGKNTRADYQGCVSIRYSDTNIQKELIILYKKIIAQKNQSMVVGN